MIDLVANDEFTIKERQVLRHLAARVAETAALRIQAGRGRLWRAMNALRPGESLA